MEWKEWNFDRESEREAGEQPVLQGYRDIQFQEGLISETGLIELVEMEPEEDQYGDQHQQRAEGRVQEEFDRRVDPPLVSPHPNDEVHRDEGYLPEDVEEEKIQRDEHPEHASPEKEQHSIVRTLLFVYLVP